MLDTDNVRVAVRIRPLSTEERERGYQNVVTRTPGTEQVVVNRNDLFTFNYVFDVNSKQEDVYNKVVLEMLDCLFRGFNATILAYGQTGSGKTHTMGTVFDGVLSEEVGLIPRSMHDIFKRIEEQKHSTDFEVSCSFLELYQEQLYDLLSEKGRENSIVDLREDRNGIIVPGLTEASVKSAIEATECLVRGSSGRAVASTAMNKQSSRSHAIFTLTLQATDKTEDKTVTTSKFHLVDLAGSERNKKTNATGDRFKEGVNINKGLLALGNVISALGSARSQGYVPYRDSKLTRMLQDSLGGNSVTLMIACVSPADYNIAETLSTLRYADRARQIKNKPIVNQDPHAAEINRLKIIIQKLRLQILASRCKNCMSNSLDNDLQTVDTSNIPAYPTNVENNIELMEKYNKLEMQFHDALHETAELQMRLHIAETAYETIGAKNKELQNAIEQLMAETTDPTPNIENVLAAARGLNEEHTRMGSELQQHRISMAESSNMNEDNGKNEDQKRNMTANEQELIRKFTLKQIDLKTQLQTIDRELNLKEELQNRIIGNMSKFDSLETLQNVEQKFRECEEKIAELEAEKNALLLQLESKNKEKVSAKLAEERRQRVNALEQQIANMKKQNLQQSKLLKVREKEANKVKNLHSEIQQMKESKVKLIRAMRQESENFRQWKLTREKELIQLRNIDRKRLNEMARKEALHQKQTNVMKRRYEHVMALHKRTQAAFDRLAKMRREKMVSSKDASGTTNNLSERILTNLEREIEVIITQIEAEHTLEQLMDDRGIISSRIEELRRQQDQQKVQANVTQAEAALQLSSELVNLEEELEMRNAQIADLQQKVCGIDVETRQRQLCESIQDVATARAMFNKAVSFLVIMRRDDIIRTAELRNSLEEQKAKCDLAEENNQVMSKRMRLMKMENEETLAANEHAYEEKIAVLLRELHSRAQQTAEPTAEQQECMRIESEQLDKFDEMREQLEEYKRLVMELEIKSGAKRRKTVHPLKKEDIFLLSSSSDDIEHLETDPDWQQTPLQRRRKHRSTTILQTRRTTTTTNNLNNSEETYLTAKNEHMNEIQPIHSYLSAGDVSCKCRGKCLTKRCQCHNVGVKCDPNKCKCSKQCQNGKHNGDDENIGELDEDGDSKMTINEEVSQDCSNESAHSEDQKENRSNNRMDSVVIKTEKKSILTEPATPNLVKFTTLEFSTPSIPKRFFP